MRRIIAIAGALVLLLSGCQSDKKPAPAPVATGNLCERMLPKLAGTWKVTAALPSALAPMADSCKLTDTEAPQHMVRVSLSILPVSAAEAVRLRKVTEENFRSGHVAAKVMDGGLGEGSWTLDPVAAAPQLGFRTADRLVLIRGDSAYGSAYRSDRSTLAELRDMAKAITELPNGLPIAAPIVDPPHCAPGLAAAEKALGTKAVLRRGGTVDGTTYCQWGSATDTVLIRGGGSTSDQAGIFRQYPAPPAKAVKVGDLGWQETNGYVTYRVAKTYVDVFTTRDGQAPAVLELGRAMVVSYRR
ncbi:hypothetical protein ACFVWG_24645 [Kribbella sp. NPDC058245]|uniref:hypothetical protein n=1 Tax=Kribbella sp. NPDC058245 TaxID=3346399 RepID=UPI0036EEA62A